MWHLLLKLKILNWLCIKHWIIHQIGEFFFSLKTACGLYCKEEQRDECLPEEQPAGMTFDLPEMIPGQERTSRKGLEGSKRTLVVKS